MILPLATALILFVGTHFLMSHPLRAPMVRRLGEGGFTGVYSAVSIATFGAAILLYARIPDGAMLWTAGPIVEAAVTTVMLVASVLLVGSLIKNPALVGGVTSSTDAKATGVYSVTRHPMMWAFALWGMGHITVAPTPRSLLLCSAIIILALVGAGLQDSKKTKLDPVGWVDWKARTSFTPFVAIIQGRATLGGFRLIVVLVGIALWLAASWLHGPLAGTPVGVWREPIS